MNFQIINFWPESILKPVINPDKCVEKLETTFLSIGARTKAATKFKPCAYQNMKLKQNSTL